MVPVSRISIKLLVSLTLTLSSILSCQGENNYNITSRAQPVESRVSIRDRVSLASFLTQKLQKSKQQQQIQLQTDIERPLRCGRPIETCGPRIVGGKVASIAEFPWIVSLQREKSWFGQKAYHHSCGGSLLTASWIITAAHCLYNRDEPLRAVAGTDNLKYMHRAQTRSISKAVMHPMFDSTSYDNDVALLKVNRPYNLRSTFSRVSAICLESNVPVDPYDIVTICGFGAKAFHENVRNHLYKTDIAIVDQITCNRSFSNMITNNMICAGGMVANKRDACSGDSGGPLQMDVDDYISLVGLVSFGNDCALKDYPGVYTRLDNFYDWIVNSIDEPLIEP